MKRWIAGDGGKTEQMSNGTHSQQVVNKPQRANAQYSRCRQQYFIINKPARGYNLIISRIIM